MRRSGSCRKANLFVPFAPDMNRQRGQRSGRMRGKMMDKDRVCLLLAVLMDRLIS